MNKEELRVIKRSIWMDKDNPLYPYWFEKYYKDEVKDVVIKLNNTPTQNLIIELKTTRRSYKKEKIPIIMRNRQFTSGSLVKHKFK